MLQSVDTQVIFRKWIFFLTYKNREFLGGGGAQGLCDHVGIVYRNRAELGPCPSNYHF